MTIILSEKSCLSVATAQNSQVRIKFKNLYSYILYNKWGTNPKNIKMEERQLNADGECDYDFKYDTLFFKVKNRTYLKSVEAGNFILDIDSESFLTGVQIPDASKLLGIDKIKLRDIPKWSFQGKIKDGIMEMSLVFQIQVRNKMIEKNPIVFQQAPEGLPNSQLICN